MAHEGVTTAPPAELISTTRTHEGPLLKIDLDEVRLPGGAVAHLESIRHPGAAAVLPVLGDGRVLLVNQYRHAMGGWILEVPAGKLDDGEAPSVCAAREVEEEVGHKVGALLELGAIFTTPGFTDEVIWLYEAHDLEATEIAHEADEVIEVVTMDFDEAVAAVQDGRIRDGKSVATILHAAIRRIQSA
ncbi:ADP-ribose pyrophosphatase [bacterium]|nr:MAG: ADP-ribose pyrophosphatase [bacterium]